MLTWSEIETNAILFQKIWKNTTGEEKSLGQTFERDFLKIFAVDEYTGLHEHQVYLKDGSVAYADYLLPGKFLIEMKSKGKSLILAFNQAMNYVNALKPEEKPRLIMCSDFDKILIHNLEKNFTYKEFKVSQLKDHVRIFGLLAGYKNKTDETVEIEVNTQASYKIAEIHDSLKEKGYLGHELELFMVRLVFCLFAEDTGIFEKESFEKYIETTRIDGSDLSAKLLSLFSVLDTPIEKRPKGLPDNLEKFRYINGSIFSDKLPLASFDQKMRSLLLQCSKDFNWSRISPAIFGAMFQGVMDDVSRRKIGAHYTSRENIMKVLKPLFLEDLYSEFEKSKSTKKELEAFQKKLSNLNFLDPACGSGNFLIVAYEELRRLEFEVLKLLYDHKENMFLDVVSMVKPEQFNGIEIEDFPAQIANLSMVLIKHLLDQEISNYFGSNSIDFPIKKNAKIIVGDSLEIEWSDLVPYDELDYIIGNPPFIGANLMTKAQKIQLKNIFLDKEAKVTSNSGFNDYVTCWFYKSSKIMLNNKKLKASFVATNSITQGQQVQSVWEVLYNLFNIKIDFAFKSFEWSNDAKNQASVHVVIIGFSSTKNETNKAIFDSDSNKKIVSKINPYLLERENIFIKSRTNPISNVSQMFGGNKPGDGNFLILTEQEKNELLLKFPKAASIVRPYLSSKDFLYNIKRYCIWFKDSNPSNFSDVKEIIDRIEKVKNYRLKSPRLQTVKDASKPYLFQEIRQPSNRYLLIPETSSYKRKYIPMGYLEPNIIAGGGSRLIDNASLYELGMLTSKAHMVWTKAICGRLRNDLTYSASLVYNNFPWPIPSNAQKEKISQTAQSILEIRSKYSESSLAELYDPLLMPVDLLKAHEHNDKAVWEAYGKAWDFNSEEDCLSHLFELYEKLDSN